jgi:hypothetical protein
LVVLVAAIGVVLLSVQVNVAAAGLPTHVGAKHVMWAKGQGYPTAQQVSANNLLYHGGLVETVPSIYLVYWGP